MTASWNLHSRWPTPAVPVPCRSMTPEAMKFPSVRLGEFHLSLEFLMLSKELRGPGCPETYPLCNKTAILGLPDRVNRRKPSAGKRHGLFERILADRSHPEMGYAAACTHLMPCRSRSHQHRQLHNHGISLSVARSTSTKEKENRRTCCIAPDVH